MGQPITAGRTPNEEPPLMCIVKTPKVDPANNKAPEPTVIRNPYLDGADPSTKALRKGRSNLRIERGEGRVSSPVAPLNPSAAPAPVMSGLPTSPVMGGGFGAGRITRDMAR